MSQGLTKDRQTSRRQALIIRSCASSYPESHSEDALVYCFRQTQGFEAVAPAPESLLVAAAAALVAATATPAPAPTMALIVVVVRHVAGDGCRGRSNTGTTSFADLGTAAAAAAAATVLRFLPSLPISFRLSSCLLIDESDESTVH